jgi:hypothetical protein
MPNLKLQSIKFTRKIIEDRLPELQRKFLLSSKSFGAVSGKMYSLS